MENNEVKLNITFTFTEGANVTDKDVEQIIDNLLTAIQHQINSGNGIAPEEPEHEDYITEIVSIEDENGRGVTYDLSNGNFI